MEKTPTLSASQKALALKDYGISPCTKCSARDGSCCGCPAGREYESKIQAAKKAKMKDEAELFSQLMELTRKANEIKACLITCGFTAAEIEDAVKRNLEP